MNLAKISANGQITVPVEIRRELGLKSGDKILFSRNDNGEIVMNNVSANALFKVQKAFAGIAEELNNPGEEEIQSWVNEVRYGNQDPNECV
jgi:AbrB family looped-hinge helix DNA binding protein